jgi:hypothetical protein
MTIALQPQFQTSLPGLCPVEAAVEELARAGQDERGAIFTRREVVDFILDLVGYTPDKPLASQRILEPSFGGGDFLLPIIDRLLASWRSEGSPNPVAALADALYAVELHHDTFARTATEVRARLLDEGLSSHAADALIEAWLHRGDFLLADLGAPFTYVVGNPPYVRQELIPDPLMSAYRARFATIYDRADLYVPFIERSLMALVEGGQLGFICADRWMKNRYGGPLRQLVADCYHLRTYVDMVDTPAFHAEVVAYPAIFVIANERGTITRVARRPSIDKTSLAALASRLVSATGDAVETQTVVARGAEPWLLNGGDSLELVRRLEATLPTLEEAGCKVGIGVATGADKAFIGPLDQLDVEEDRKLPIVMTRDIDSGSIRWRGYGVINPFVKQGGLVNLDDYPRLKNYLEARKNEIARRHVAKKSPDNWYRTIDRIYPELVAKPKLLIPDIKGEAHIVYDEGRFYPHHNLYFITSNEWDLRALQTVLMSGIARLFIATYSTTMRGGYLRFQAQYLRRIRVPHWSAVPNVVRAQLVAAGTTGDRRSCDEAIAQLYGLTPSESALISNGGRV